MTSEENLQKDKSLKKCEILAPAGSMEALVAAVSAGADAVYFGSALSARAYAKNFSNNEVIKAIEYLRNRGAKSYITLNTLMTDRELRQISEFVKLINDAGADAVILQDLGIARLISSWAPELNMHLSTQAGAHGLSALEQAQKLGFSRAVLARELNANEIENIIKSTDIETEVFVHGALCYSYSGSCLMSALIGGRSGNRGKCAQPCRLPFGENKYPMSLKEHCLAGFVPELMKMGVTSLKIEGRMRRPEYVSAVTRLYRNLVDENRAATSKEIEYISKIFNRDGFTSRYFSGNKGPAMLGIKSTNASSDILLKERQLTVEKKAKKTAFVQREFFDIVNKVNDFKVKKPKFEGLFWKALQVPVDLSFFDRVFIELDEALTFDNLPEKSGVILPFVIHDNEISDIIDKLILAKNKGAVSALLQNIGHIDIVKKSGLLPVGGHFLNVFNSHSLESYANLGVTSATVSAELMRAQIRDMKKPIRTSLFAYGKLPLMVTENCIVKNIKGCGDNCQMPYMVTDRANESFTVLNQPFCRNIILNSKPIYLADKLNDFKDIGLSYLSLYFFDETKEDVIKIIKAYQNYEERELDFTRGLYYRGCL